MLPLSEHKLVRFGSGLSVRRSQHLNRCSRCLNQGHHFEWGTHVDVEGDGDPGTEADIAADGTADEDDAPPETGSSLGRVVMNLAYASPSAV